MRNLLPTLLDRPRLASRLMDDLFEDTTLDRWFDRWFFDDALMRWPTVQSRLTRPLELRETSDEYFVRCELPGWDANDVHVELAGDVLTIRGEMGQRGDAQAEGSASFTRSIRLDVELDVEGVEAELKNGVLMVRLPKSEAVKPRRIEIRSTSGGSSPQLEHRPEKEVSVASPSSAVEATKDPSAA